MRRMFVVVSLVLGVASLASAEDDRTHISGKIAYNAHLLFRSGNCEVWGLTYKNQNFVVTLCPTKTEKE
jgi:hypothetical protein